MCGGLNQVDKKVQMSVLLLEFMCPHSNILIKKVDKKGTNVRLITWVHVSTF